MAGLLLPSSGSATTISVGSLLTLSDGPGKNGGGESYSPTAGFSGDLQDQLALIDTPPQLLIQTPEPGTLSLLGLGLFGIARLVRRRQLDDSKTRPTVPEESVQQPPQGWTTETE